MLLKKKIDGNVDSKKEYKPRTALQRAAVKRNWNMLMLKGVQAHVGMILWYTGIYHTYEGIELRRLLEDLKHKIDDTWEAEKASIQKQLEIEREVNLSTKGKT